MTRTSTGIAIAFPFGQRPMVPLKQVMMILLVIFDKYILVLLFGIEVIGETEVDIVMSEVLP